MNDARLHTMDDSQHPNDELLFDLAAGTLDRATRSRVEQHVATCDRCRADLAAASATTALLSGVVEQQGRGALVESFPSDVAERFHVDLQSEFVDRAARHRAAREALPRWRRVLNVALSFALAGAMVGVSVNVLSSENGGVTQQAKTASSAALEQDAAAPAAASYGATRGNAQEQTADEDMPSPATGSAKGTTSVPGESGGAPPHMSDSAGDSRTATGRQPEAETLGTGADDGNTGYVQHSNACLLEFGAYVPSSGDIASGGLTGVTSVAAAWPDGRIRLVCVA